MQLPPGLGFSPVPSSYYYTTQRVESQPDRYFKPICPYSTIKVELGVGMKKTKEELLLAKSIGRIIAKRRVDNEMTQEYVAERLGVGYEAVSRMERGAIMPTVGKLVQLAGVFDCPVEELLVEASNRASDQSVVISKMIEGLPETDRAFMLTLIEQVASKLKEKSSGTPKRSKKA